MTNIDELKGDLRDVDTAVKDNPRQSENSGDCCAVVADAAELACDSRGVDAVADAGVRRSDGTND